MIEAAIAISKQNLEGTITAAMKAMPMLPLEPDIIPQPRNIPEADCSFPEVNPAFGDI